MTDWPHSASITVHQQASRPNQARQPNDSVMAVNWKVVSDSKKGSLLESCGSFEAPRRDLRLDAQEDLLLCLMCTDLFDTYLICSLSLFLNSYNVTFFFFTLQSKDCGKHESTTKLKHNECGGNQIATCHKFT